MKTSYLVFLVSALVAISVGIWLYFAGFNFTVWEIGQFGIIFLLVGFGIYTAVRRLKSEGRNQPAEDELSKKIMQKAASLSFYISLYLWLVIMYISDKKAIEPDVLFGSGILGMAVIWVFCWGYFNVKGVKDE